jgi:hypothetical protein
VIGHRRDHARQCPDEVIGAAPTASPSSRRWSPPTDPRAASERLVALIQGGAGLDRPPLPL